LGQFLPGTANTDEARTPITEHGRQGGLESGAGPCVFNVPV